VCSQLTTELLGVYITITASRGAAGGKIGRVEGNGKWERNKERNGKEQG